MARFAEQIADLSLPEEISVLAGTALRAVVDQQPLRAEAAGQELLTCQRSKCVELVPGNPARLHRVLLVTSTALSAVGDTAGSGEAPGVCVPACSHVDDPRPLNVVGPVFVGWA